MDSPRRAVAAVAAAVVAVFAVGLRVLDGDALLWWSDLGLAAAAVAATVALGWRARRSSGPMRTTWRWMAWACASWSVGQAAWSWQQLSGMDPLPFPSIADVPYMLAMPMATMAVLSHIGCGLRRRQHLFDGVLAAGATLAAAWSALLVATPGNLDGASTVDLIAVAYPVTNLAVAALLGVVATRVASDDSGAVAAIASAWSVLGAANLGYGWLVTQDRYFTGHLLDTLYVVAMVGLVAVAVRPPTRRLSRATDAGRLVVALPYLPLAVAGPLVVVGQLRFDAVLTVATVAVVLAFMGRQYAALLENQALTRQLEERVVDRTAELASSEARYRNALAGAGIGSFEVDLDSGRVHWSLETQAIHGIEPGTFGGTLTDAIAFVHPDDQPALAAGWAMLQSDQDQPLELRIVRPDGTTRWVEARGSVRDDGNRRLLTGVITDVTARRAAAAELDRLAHTDALTGLPNRARLLQLLTRALDGREELALLLMDLDGFKAVNDGLGHDVGDRFLDEVATRLRAGVRGGDVVARLGGDEFAIVVLGGDAAAGVRVARDLIAALREPVDVAGLRLPVAASVGIAAAPGHASTPRDLLRHADVAMYRAKQRGGTWAVFDGDADSSRAGRLALLADLRAAIDDGAIDVHFQPQVELATGRVVAVEALARWNHPERGFVAPTEFIELAEHSGLIRDLTPLVLARSLEQCARWRAEGFDLQVAVNLSPRLLHDPNVVAAIDRALLEARVPPSALTIEITEGAFADEAPAVEQSLAALRGLGVRLAVDDFGTGYSSLAYLKRLPVDDVKIDRSFISGLPGHADSGIVQAVLELARHLELSVVAEGVEEGDTLDLLRGWGCAMAQGYHLARPQPAPALTAWLADRTEHRSLAR